MKKIAFFISTLLFFPLASMENKKITNITDKITLLTTDNQEITVDVATAKQLKPIKLALEDLGNSNQSEVKIPVNTTTKKLSILLNHLTMNQKEQKNALKIMNLETLLETTMLADQFEAPTDLQKLLITQIAKRACKTAGNIDDKEPEKQLESFLNSVEGVGLHHTIEKRIKDVCTPEIPLPKNYVETVFEEAYKNRLDLNDYIVSAMSSNNKYCIYTDKTILGTKKRDIYLAEIEHNKKTKTKKIEIPPPNYDSFPLSVEFFLDNKHFALAQANTIYLYDIKSSDNPSKKYRDHKKIIDQLVLSPNGKLLASASKEEKKILLYLFNNNSLSLIHQLEHCTNEFCYVQFSKNNEYLSTTIDCNTGICRLYDKENQLNIQKIDDENLSCLSDLYFSDDGNYAAGIKNLNVIHILKKNKSTEKFDLFYLISDKKFGIIDSVRFLQNNLFLIVKGYQSVYLYCINDNKSIKVQSLNKLPDTYNYVLLHSNRYILDDLRLNEINPKGAIENISFTEYKESPESFHLSNDEKLLIIRTKKGDSLLNLQKLKLKQELSFWQLLLLNFLCEHPYSGRKFKNKKTQNEFEKLKNLFGIASKKGNNDKF